MKYTASFQNNGAAPNYKHNKREKEYIDKEITTSIDLNREHITLKDENIEEVYAKLFGPALEEWNEKQIKNHRSNKVMTMDQYIKKIKEEDKLYRKEVRHIMRNNHLTSKEKSQKLKKVSHKPRLVYEAIVQVGNVDTIPPLGSEDRKEFDKKLKCIYQKYFDDFEKNNPNMYLTGAYMHFDEAGTPHMHIDYIPVAYNCKTGMKTAPSLNKALIAMGFVDGRYSYTPQQMWQDSQRDLICEIAKEFGIEATFEDRRRQGIMQLKAEHKPTYEYVQQRQLEANKLKEENALLKEKNTSLEKENEELAARRKRQYNQINERNEIMNKQRKIETAISQSIDKKKEELSGLEAEIEKKRSNLANIDKIAAIKAQKVIDEAEKQAQKVLDDAQRKFDKAIADADAFANDITKNADKDANDIIDKAYEEADEIRKKANKKAERILEAAEARKELLEEDIAESERYIKVLENQKNFIQDTIKKLEEASENYDKDFITQIKNNAELELRRQQDEIFGKFFDKTTKLCLSFDEELPDRFSKSMQDNLNIFYDRVNAVYEKNGWEAPYKDEEYIEEEYERTI